jgi:hypothetical protein
MSSPVIHIRRAFAPIAECLAASLPPMELVDSPEEATCNECVASFERRQTDWLRTLRQNTRGGYRFGTKKKR